MLSQNVIIAIVTVIIGIGIMFGVVNKEGFCNCTGMAARTAYPTYYTYRPFGDVSDYPSCGRQGSNSYRNDYLNRASNGQFIKIGAELPPMSPFFNLGWKTGMPYDSFVASSGNNWVAGSDPFFKTHSSVPMLALGAYGQEESRIDPRGVFAAPCSSGNNIYKSKNGGYATHYGNSFNNDLGSINNISGSQFVTGQYGFPNMLSNGQPEYVGPAGSFSESAMPCGASQNAYNLAVGVL